ncbi:MAG: 6,7-dimethyl-8-ribityllumazine synthase [Schleiferiaceae bacterium]|jgi:6,7-dimethyl-8-ribityllumazine synthase|nr:6,7-dimethyl-8-ribityllumazine synthase [Schleiferiaceae bacterium]
MATAGKNLSEYNKAKMPNAENMVFGIVVSEWNESITEGLCKGAIDTLLENNVAQENIDRLDVPGSYELTYGAQHMVNTNKYDAVIVIGSVIQGETKHFDFVCQGVTNGISHLNATQNIPVIFCVLTDNTMQQAIDRSGGIHGNKGTEAAVAAIRMAEIKVRSHKPNGEIGF